MADLTRFGGPFLLYADAVRDGCIAAGAYPSPEWFATQLARIGRAYDLGEPLATLVPTIVEFGRAAAVRRTKTPRALAARVVRCG